MFCWIDFKLIYRNAKDMGIPTTTNAGLYEHAPNPELSHFALSIFCLHGQLSVPPSTQTHPVYRHANIRSHHWHIPCKCSNRA